MPKLQEKKTKKDRAKDKPYSRSTQDGPPADSDDPEEPSICPVCEVIIKEPSDDSRDPGDEALFCEGKCKAWYCSVPYAYGTYHMRIRIWYNHTRMVWIIVPYAYGAYETPLVYIVNSLSL